MTPRGDPPSRLVITGASTSYLPSLLAWLGSLTLNWPEHPPVLVYDLGLEQDALDLLQHHGVEVRKVPEFCPHWRSHFTWKLWAWQDAPADQFFWLDAGAVVLGSLDAVFASIDAMGYFVVPTFYPLTENASEAACRGCKVDPDFRQGKMTLAGGITGFDKRRFGSLLREALEVGLVEEHIKATELLHRHDQAILSLLLYRDLGSPLMADGLVYGGWKSPQQTIDQRIWVHRRSLAREDQEHFARHMSRPGTPYQPRPPKPRPPNLRAVAGRVLYTFIPEPTRRPYDGVKD